MARQPDHAHAATRQPIERWLIALAGVALWSMVPPYLGPLIGLELDVDASLEVVDHIVPGVSAFAGALIALGEARLGRTDSVRYLVALSVGVLAGLFQCVTHFPLVLDAGGPLQPVDSVVLHSTPGPVLMLLALFLLLRPPAADSAR